VPGVLLLVASPGDDQQPAAGRDQPGGRTVRNGSMPPGSRMACAVAGRSVVSAVAGDSVPGLSRLGEQSAGPGCGWTSGGEDAEGLVFEISSRWLSSPGGCVR
jgi:hypothetical protein